MRLTCPLNGTRDSREFTYQGADDMLTRPAADAGDAAWDDYLHNRDNPCGATRDLWYHEPSRTWIAVTRDTATHAVTGGDLVGKAKP